MASRKTIIWVIGGIIALLIVIGVAAAINRGRPGTTLTQASSSPQNSFASPTPVVVQPVASPSPSVSASPSVPQDLPSSAQDFIAKFYADYQAKNRDRLASYFTADSTPDLTSLHSRLFLGQDPQGNPGGPTLFSSNSASETVKSYRIISSVPQDSNWIVTVKEQRLTVSGQPLAEQTNLLTLVPASGSKPGWQIDNYAHAGSSGKYSAFLLQ